MSRLFLDFETFYTHEYSLKRLSVESYCRDERFEIICAGCGVDDQEPFVLDWRDLSALPGLVAGASEVVCHNAAFDGYILESVLGIKAESLSCTRTMPRWTGLGWMTGSSLGQLASALLLGVKGDALAMSLGKRRGDFSPQEFEEFKRYCVHDVRLTALLYDRLRPRVTDDAMRFMSMTIKMYTDPAIRLDADWLRTYREEVVARQESDQETLQSLFRFGDREQFLKALRSPDKFVKMLRELGAEPPMKTTEASLAAFERAKVDGAALVEVLRTRPPTKAEKARAATLAKTIRAAGRIPALAKDDQGFRELLADPDPNVAMLASLRADNNSPIAISRAETFLAVAGRGPLLPIPLAAWGAHTGRYAAGTGGRDAESDRTNLQNLPKRKGDVSLRKALRAPAGHVLVSGDSAQIEARVGAWLAGQDDLVATFAAGGDPYVEMAEAIYGIPAEDIRKGAKVDHDQRMITMRDVGKTTMLSSQYGIGAAKFSQYLLRNGLRLDPDLAVHEDKAAGINRIYGRKYAAIAAFRKVCHATASAMLDPGYESAPWTRAELIVKGNHVVEAGFSAPAIILPNGYPLVYPKLRQAENNLVYSLYKGKCKWEDKRLYGGALFNNITQGLAFAVLAWQGVRLADAGLRVALNVHDEWVCVVSGALADEAAEYMKAVLETAPPWTPGLPLGSDVRISESFA